MRSAFNSGCTFPHRKAAKQDPGVQDGEYGRAHHAGDAIADPSRFLTYESVWKPSLLRHHDVALFLRIQEMLFENLNMAGDPCWM